MSETLTVLRYSFRHFSQRHSLSSSQSSTLTSTPIHQQAEKDFPASMAQ